MILKCSGGCVPSLADAAKIGRGHRDDSGNTRFHPLQLPLSVAPIRGPFASLDGFTKARAVEATAFCPAPFSTESDFALQGRRQVRLPMQSGARRFEFARTAAP